MSNTTVAAPKARKPRTTRVLTELEQQLLSEPIAALATAKAQEKEARSIVKVISGVQKLSPWGLSKVTSAITARMDQVSAS